MGVGVWARGPVLSMPIGWSCLSWLPWADQLRAPLYTEKFTACDIMQVEMGEATPFHRALRR